MPTLEQKIMDSEKRVDEKFEEDIFDPNDIFFPSQKEMSKEKEHETPHTKVETPFISPQLSTEKESGVKDIPAEVETVEVNQRDRAVETASPAPKPKVRTSTSPRKQVKEEKSDEAWKIFSEEINKEIEPAPKGSYRCYIFEENKLYLDAIFGISNPVLVNAMFKAFIKTHKRELKLLCDDLNPFNSL